MAGFLDEGNNVLSELGTGVGKSHIAHCLAATSGSSFIVTSDNQLVRQYESDFDGVSGFCSIKGRSNYSCLGDYGDCETGIDSERCRHSKDSKIKEADCPYVMKKREAQQAPVAFTNIAYYASATRFGDDWGKRELTVFDEAHSLENSIQSLVETEISGWRLSVLDKANIKVTANTLRSLPSETGWEPNQWWKKSDGRPITARAILGMAERIVSQGETAIQGYSGMTRMAGLRKALINLVDAMQKFLFKPDNDLWVVDLFEYEPGTPECDQHGPIRLLARPVYIRDYTKQLIFCQAEKFVFQSATIIDGKQFAYELGINDWQGVRFKTPFESINRRVYPMSCGSLSRDGFDENIGNCMAKLEEILGVRAGQKGIVHTASYKLQQYLKNNLKSNRRYLFPMAGESEEYLRVHADSVTPTVLFSPAMTQGVDLKDDLARFNVIFKVPYPNLGDRRIKKKAHINQGWYDYATAKSVVQAMGRGVRSEDDWCDTFILDTCFDRLYKKYDKLQFYLGDSIELNREKGNKAIYERRD